MAEDDHFDIPELPIIKSENQTNEKRSDDLQKSAVAEMKQTEKNRGKKNSNNWTFKKYFQPRH
jgi:hypothetical protein